MSLRTQLLLLMFAVAPTAAAQTFAARADAGDVAATTDAGQTFHDAVAPELQRAMFGCLQGADALTVGTTVTMIAYVSREGLPKAVETQPAAPNARCIEQRLFASKLPPPARWNFAQGDFPLTVRVGVGRGRFNEGAGQ